MGIGYLLVLGFVAFAAFKFYKTQKAIEKDLSNRAQAPPGVSYYCNLAVASRPQFVEAFANTNPNMATERGFAPAFGPTENMPPSCQEVSFP